MQSKQQQRIHAINSRRGELESKLETTTAELTEQISGLVTNQRALINTVDRLTDITERNTTNYQDLSTMYTALNARYHAMSSLHDEDIASLTAKYSTLYKIVGVVGGLQIGAGFVLLVRLFIGA